MRPTLEPRARPSPWRLALAFAVLFTLYQLPEGVGQRLLGSFPAVAGLLGLYYLGAYGVSRWLGYRGLRAYALGGHPGWARNLGVGLTLAAGAKLLALAVGVRLGVYTVALAPPAAGPFVAGLLGAAVLTLLPSVAEDLLTRGFWWRAVPVRWTTAGFVLVSSAVYVLNHVYRLANGPLEWGMLFCFGLAYAAGVARTGSLWAAIGLHWGWNLTNAAADVAAATTVLRPEVSPLLSAAAHLALLGVMLASPRLFAQAPGPLRGAPAPPGSAPGEP